MSFALYVIYYQKLLKSKLLDSFYYQFAQLCELKAPKDIYLKNIVIHKHYKYN